VEEGRPSNTALLVAALRAYHYLATPEPRIVNDSLAMALAGITSTDHVTRYYQGIVNAMTALSERSIAEVMVHSLLMSVCARSRFAEDQLAASRARGMQQLIILGAGLDSTAYRCAELTAGLQIFEVDYPATQIWKRKQLAASGIAVPDNLTFVPFDFERQTLSAALRAGGVRNDAMSFFSWLGVQPYLSDDIVMATLDEVAGFAAGSELVLDLVTIDDPNQSAAMTDGLRKARENVAKLGEPFKSKYDPEVFRDRLQQRGFDHIDMLGVNEWLTRHHARFQGRFTATGPTPFLVSAQVGVS
jgi:methyltransferase (TIGR00027 family)